jgi:muconolactone delta-isomerase
VPGGAFPDHELTLIGAHASDGRTEEESMEFLVEFEVTVPGGTPEPEVEERESAEAMAAAALGEQGHLLRVWRLTARNGQGPVLGLYRADSRSQLDGLLKALPLYEWMKIKITPLEPHPNDPNVETPGS